MESSEQQGAKERLLKDLDAFATFVDEKGERIGMAVVPGLLLQLRRLKTALLAPSVKTVTVEGVRRGLSEIQGKVRNNIAKNFTLNKRRRDREREAVAGFHRGDRVWYGEEPCMVATEPSAGVTRLRIMRYDGYECNVTPGSIRRHDANNTQEDQNRQQYIDQRLMILDTVTSWFTDSDTVRTWMAPHLEETAPFNTDFPKRVQMLVDAGYSADAARDALTTRAINLALQNPAKMIQGIVKHVPSSVILEVLQDKDAKLNYVLTQQSAACIRRLLDQVSSELFSGARKAKGR